MTAYAAVYSLTRSHGAGGTNEWIMKKILNQSTNSRLAACLFWMDGKALTVPRRTNAECASCAICGWFIVCNCLSAPAHLFQLPQKRSKQRQRQQCEPTSPTNHPTDITTTSIRTLAACLSTNMVYFPFFFLSFSILIFSFVVAVVVICIPRIGTTKVKFILMWIWIARHHRRHQNEIENPFLLHPSAPQSLLAW